MDPENPPSLRSRLLTGLAALVGAFLLYALSVGPALYLSIRTGVEPKRWIGFYTPAFVVIEWALMNPARDAYIQWWAELTWRHMGASGY